MEEKLGILVIGDELSERVLFELLMLEVAGVVVDVPVIATSLLLMYPVQPFSGSCSGGTEIDLHALAAVLDATDVLFALLTHPFSGSSSGGKNIRLHALAELVAELLVTALVVVAVVVEEGAFVILSAVLFTSGWVLEAFSSSESSLSESPSSEFSSFESPLSDPPPPEDPAELPPMCGQIMPKHVGIFGPPPGHNMPPHVGVQCIPPGPTIIGKVVGTTPPAGSV